MAVNASESIQSTRDLSHLEKNSTDLAGSRAAYHDLDDFEKSIHNSFSMVSWFLYFWKLVIMLHFSDHITSNNC